MEELGGYWGESGSFAGVIMVLRIIPCIPPLSIADVTVLAATRHSSLDGARLCVLHLTQLTPSRPINSLLISHSKHKHLTPPSKRHL